MNEERLIIGLPAGSLADASRGGNFIDLLRHAGFPTQGYDQGGPSMFPLNALLLGWDGRPQEFSAQLDLGEIDLAITGDDCVRERELEFKYVYNQTIHLEKVLPLQRGHVRVVIVKDGAVDECDGWLEELLARNKLVTMVSEMPYLGLEWFRAKIEKLGFARSHNDFSVQKYRTPPRIDAGIVIYETWGKTEAKVKEGSVHFGLETCETGNTIQDYGLDIVEEIMTSEMAVWANPAIRQNPAKYDLARMFLLNLHGALFAEDKVMLLFNARKDAVSKLLEYLKANRLFADEPTVNEGLHFTEFSVQMDASNPDLPIARVRYELAKLGATHIETIPLESSIPGLDVIAF